MDIAKPILQYLKKMILFRLIYGKNAAYYIEFYKPYKITGYINNNYIYNLKD